MVLAASAVPDVWTKDDEQEQELLRPDDTEDTVGGDDDLFAHMSNKIQENLVLSHDERNELVELLRQFRHVFGTTLRREGVRSTQKAFVRLKPGAVPQRISYPFHDNEKRHLLLELDRQLLELNIVEAVPHSMWVNPYFGAYKKPGLRGEKRIRGVINPCAIDPQCESIGTDPLDVRQFLAQVQGFKYGAVFDLPFCFEQVELEEDARKYFTYSGPGGLRKPRRLPQGHKNSPAMVKYTFDEVYQNVVRVQYVDDILIYGHTYEEFKSRLTAFLQRSSERNVIVKPTKEIATSEVTFLGLRISGTHVQKIHQPKWGPLRDRAPTTVGDLVTLLGVWGWFQGCVPRLALLLAPLRKIVRDAGETSKARGARLPLSEFGWTPQHAAWVGEIWKAIDGALALALPDPNKQICVFSDASSLGGAYVVCQYENTEENNPPHERSYEILQVWSREWQGPEVRWSVGEWELFPVHHALTQNDWLILGRPVTCYVDHANLVPLLRNPATLHKRQSVSRVIRRIMDLPPNVRVEHIPGITNTMCDYLSRQFTLPADVTPAPVVLAVLRHFVDVDSIFPMPSARLIRDHMTAGPAELEAAAAGAEQRSDGLWYVGKRIFVPTTLRSAVIAGAHCGIAGHRGVSGTLANLGSFYWVGLEAQVAAEIRECLPCRRADGPIRERPWGEVPHGRKVGELFSVDYFSMPDGYVLLWRESVSQFAFATIHERADAEGSCASLEQLMAATGCLPTIVESDGGPHFRGAFEKRLKQLNITQKLHHPRNPQANGSIENLGKQLSNTMLKLLTERMLPISRWRMVLHIAIFAMNNSPSALLLGHAPLEVFTGRERFDLSKLASNVDLSDLGDRQLTLGELESMVRDLREILMKTETEVVQHKDRVRERRHQNRASRSDVSPIDFGIGDLVLVSTEGSLEGIGNKLSPRWTGPYEVVGMENPLMVELRQLGSQRRFVAHAQRVQRFQGPEPNLDSSEYGKALIRSADLSLRGRYLVDRIVDVEQRGPMTFVFRVRWLGYGEEDDTWESAPRLYGQVEEVVEEYLAREDLPIHVRNMLPGIRESLNRRATRTTVDKQRKYVNPI